VNFIEPDWPAPPQVRALGTTRHGGVSSGAFSALNLGSHVGDDPAAVAENRRRLLLGAALPAMPRWLNQVHGHSLVDAAASAAGVAADGTFTDQPGVVCAVLTADCLPLLLCASDGSRVAAVHAGWRGLAAGIIAAAVKRLRAGARIELLAWLGPAISAPVYEVDEPVRTALLGADPAAADSFSPGRPGHWQLDLAGEARRQLAAAGCRQVYGGSLCTLSAADRFYSHRRDGRCGRQATLIWLAG